VFIVAKNRFTIIAAKREVKEKDARGLTMCNKSKRLKKLITNSIMQQCLHDKGQRYGEKATKKKKTRS